LQIFDSDNDGVPDDKDAVDALAHLGRYNHGYSLVCGISQSEERKEESIKEIIRFLVKHILGLLKMCSEQ
jgi:hypothetical protein